MPTSVPGFKSGWMNSKWTPHGRRMGVHRWLNETFSGPDIPKAPKPPAPPAIPLDPALQDARLRERARQSAAYGRRGTIATGPSGVSSPATLGYPVVLG